MPERAWDPVVALLDQAVADGVVPGVALCVRSADHVLFSYAAGHAELEPRRRAACEDTAWDLASLTKVLCTTPLCLRLHEQGRLDLDEPLDALLPDAPPGVTARHCLLHSSGLPAWRPLFQEVIARGWAWGAPATRQAVLHAARTTPTVAGPGARHAYSDLGMLLLGAAIEAREGERIDRLWEREVRCWMGVDLRWGWPDAAATERCPVRQRVIVGEVHDLNAAVLGGLAPHAGLFGSAAQVAAAGAWHLRCAQGRERGLSPETLDQAWSAEGPGSHHLGWDGVSPQGSSASDRWPPDGVGHLGFTGTSLWLAPRQDVVVALLSNRVHPEVEGGSVPGAAPGPRTRAFRVLRPAVHQAVVEALETLGRW